MAVLLGQGTKDSISIKEFMNSKTKECRTFLPEHTRISLDNKPIWAKEQKNMLFITKKNDGWKKKMTELTVRVYK